MTPLTFRNRCKVDILNTHIHDRSLLETGAKSISLAHIYMTPLTFRNRCKVDILNTHIHDRSLLETGAMSISLTHIYMTAHFSFADWLSLLLRLTD